MNNHKKKKREFTTKLFTRGKRFSTYSSKVGVQSCFNKEQAKVDLFAKLSDKCNRE